MQTIKNNIKRAVTEALLSLDSVLDVGAMKIQNSQKTIHVEMFRAERFFNKKRLKSPTTPAKYMSPPTSSF